MRAFSARGVSASLVQDSHCASGFDHISLAYSEGAASGSITSVSSPLLTTTRRSSPSPLARGDQEKNPDESVTPLTSVTNFSSFTPSTRICAPLTGSAVDSDVTAKRTRVGSSIAESERSVTCTRSQRRLSSSTARNPTR